MAKYKNPKTSRTKTGSESKDESPEDATIYAGRRFIERGDELRRLAAEMDGLAKAMKDEGVEEAKVTDKMVDRSITFITNFIDNCLIAIRKEARKQKK